MDVGAEALGADLRHHRQQPQQPDRDVQAVAADQREEGRQEGAARRPGALRDDVGELAELEREERAPSSTVTRRSASTGMSARDAAMLAMPQAKLDSSRQAGLDRDVREVEQLRPVGPPLVVPCSTA